MEEAAQTLVYLAPVGLGCEICVVCGDRASGEKQSSVIEFLRFHKVNIHVVKISINLTRACVPLGIAD
jgi:hypothetical protein